MVEQMIAARRAAERAFEDEWAEHGRKERENIQKICELGFSWEEATTIYAAAVSFKEGTVLEASQKIIEFMNSIELGKTELSNLKFSFSLNQYTAVSEFVQENMKDVKLFHNGQVKNMHKVAIIIKKKSQSV